MLFLSLEVEYSSKLIVSEQETQSDIRAESTNDGSVEQQGDAQPIAHVTHFKTWLAQ